MKVLVRPVWRLQRYVRRAERLRDLRVLALMSKTTVQEDPAFAASSGNAPPTRVTVILQDGRHIAHEIDDMIASGATAQAP